MCASAMCCSTGIHAVFAGARGFNVTGCDVCASARSCASVRRANCYEPSRSKLPLDAVTVGVSLHTDMQGVILFDVSDKKWTLDLSSGAGSLKEGDTDNADLTLTMNDENFAKLVSGKLNPQQVRFQGTRCILVWYGPCQHGRFITFVVS